MLNHQCSRVSTAIGVATHALSSAIEADAAARQHRAGVASQIRQDRMPANRPDACAEDAGKSRAWRARTHRIQLGGGGGGTHGLRDGVEAVAGEKRTYKHYRARVQSHRQTLYNCDSPLSPDAHCHAECARASEGTHMRNKRE